MGNLVRTAFAFVGALIVGVAVASAAHTHFVLEELRALGTEIPLPLEIETMVQDVEGLAPMLGAILAAGFFIAFIAGGLVARVTGLRPIVFLVAGATAVVAAHLISKECLGVTGIAGARTLAGLIAQGGAGALAGLVFAALTPHRE